MSIMSSRPDQWAGKKSNGKASFPPQLKPPLLETAKVIFQHELLSEREEDLRNGIFTSLPACLPFNTTTLRVCSLSTSTSSLAFADEIRNSSTEPAKKHTGTFSKSAKTLGWNACRTMSSRSKTSGSRNTTSRSNSGSRDRKVSPAVPSLPGSGS